MCVSLLRQDLPDGGRRVLHQEGSVVRPGCEDTCGYCQLQCPNCSSFAQLQEQHVHGTVKHVWSILPATPVTPATPATLAVPATTSPATSLAASSQQAIFPAEVPVHRHLQNQRTNSLGWHFASTKESVHHRNNNKANGRTDSAYETSLDSISDKSYRDLSPATAPPLSRPSSGNSDLYDLSKGKPESYQKRSIGFELFVDNRRNRSENRMGDHSPSSALSAEPNLMNPLSNLTNNDLSSSDASSVIKYNVIKKENRTPQNNTFETDHGNQIEDNKDQSSRGSNTNSEKISNRDAFDVTSLTSGAKSPSEVSLGEYQESAESLSNIIEPSPPTRPSSTVLLSAKQLLKTNRISPSPRMVTGKSPFPKSSKGHQNEDSYRAFASSPDLSADRLVDNPVFTFKEEPSSKIVTFLKEALAGVVIMTMVGAVVMFLGSLGKSIMR